MPGVIPLLDLRAQYAALKPELDAAVLDVLASGAYILGEPVERFEKAFAAYCGVEHAIAVNSGTSALHLAFLAANIGPGDEVITTPFTFVATVSAIIYAGATPVFVDVEPDSFAIDPAKVEAAITPRTKAIVPVHLYGQMADMDALQSIAVNHGLVIIEDACQAHGAAYHGHRAGSMGLSAAFSFYPGKNLGACGEGGIVVTNSEEQMRTMRSLRDWGQAERYNHVLKGFNYRMDAIQGAVLDVKLRYLEDWTEARRAVAAQYRQLLSEVESLRLPAELPGRRHVYHVFAVRTRDREGLRRHLASEGVHTGLHYPIPVHLQKAHADLGYGEGDFPVTETLAREVLSLPIFPEMTSRQIQTVADAIKQDAYVL
ncbi:glutamine--scyllo-inositol aminotransferase [Youhaiella tibetensis]|nr:glutamine--scyllo-inositol aminotransferase [Youhaiella tibetensis]